MDKKSNLIAFIESNTTGSGEKFIEAALSQNYQVLFITANPAKYPFIKKHLIFDEVDVGIGGSTAAIVGQLLHRLSHKAQVLCITHLPQVAAFGHQHFQVKKFTRHGVTTTAIASLTTEQKIQEIARMLGGLKITEQTMAHAREMLELAN